MMNYSSPFYKTPNPLSPKTNKLKMSSGSNQEQQEHQQEDGDSVLSPLSPRPRTNLRLWLRPVEEHTIRPPFPWATNNFFRIHSLDYIRSAGIRKISGEVYCKRCKAADLVELDLESKYDEVRTYIIENKSSMHGRSPERWRSPDLMDCLFCNRKGCVRAKFIDRYPVNWLFMFLSEMITFCSSDILKDFCKKGCDFRTHHRDLKDRYVYLTYLGICEQLEPNGPFSP